MRYPRVGKRCIVPKLGECKVVSASLAWVPSWEVEQVSAHSSFATSSSDRHLGPRQPATARLTDWVTPNTVLFASAVPSSASEEESEPDSEDCSGAFESMEGAIRRSEDFDPQKRISVKRMHILPESPQSPSQLKYMGEQ